MHAKISLTFTALLFLAVKGTEEDPGAQAFIHSASTPLPPPSLTPILSLPSSQPQFETKTLIVYLTPSQIRALETGQGVLEPMIEPEPQTIKDVPQTPEFIQIPQNEYDNDEEFRKEMERQKAFIETQPNIAEAIDIIQKQKDKTPPPVREPPREEPQEHAQSPWYPKDENNYYGPPAQKQEKNIYSTTSEKPENNKYNAQSTEQPESSKYNAPTSEKPEKLYPNSYNYFSVYNEKKGDNINIKIFHPAPRDKLRDELDAKNLNAQSYAPLIKNYKLIPYEYFRNKLTALEPTQGPAGGGRVTQKNTERQLGALFTPAQPEEQSRPEKYEQGNSNGNEQNLDDELLKLKYASRYNDHKHAIEIQNLIKQQKAEAQAHAIANAPPVEVHREVSITKHKPVHIINHVQVPIPEPYIVRVPEPFEVKVPQPYPVPLEIIKHVPVEIVKTEKIEVEKPVPYVVEKRVPVPVTKMVYVKVDKPYFVEKVVPVEVRKEIPVHIPIRKPQKLTIFRHIWEH